MADLEGSTPAATYRSLLNVGTNDNQELDTVLRVIEDGAGNDSSLKLTKTGSTYGASFVGRVGIGTASPDQELEVSGNIKISGGDYNGLYFEDASGAVKTLLYQHANYDALVIKDMATDENRVTFKNNGNVGIGTSLPREELDIFGDLKFGIGSGSSANIKSMENGSTSNSYRDLTIICNNFEVKTATGSEGGSTASRLYIEDTTGNVGIGTDDPNRKLSVQGQFAVQNSGDERFTVNPTSVGVDFAVKDVDGETDFRVDTRTGQKTAWYVGGNFGIGTESPVSLLDLKYESLLSSTTLARAMTAGLTLNGGAGVANDDYFPAISWYSNDASIDSTEYRVGAITCMAAENFDGANNAGVDMQFFVHKNSSDDDGPTLAMTIQDDGNVGIGIASPKTTLDVNNTTTPTLSTDTHAGEAIFIRSGGSSADGNVQAVIGFGKADGSPRRSGSAIASVQTSSDADTIGIGFYTSPTSASTQTMVQQVLIDHNGNVGIGTTAPGQIFDVNSGSGNMIVDGYDTHSLAVYKENIEDASGYLDKVLACPAQKWNRKPFVSADEIKEAVLDEFGEDVLIEEAVSAKDAVYETVEVSGAVEAKDAVMGERQKVVVTEIEEEQTSTEIVEEGGKYIQKTTTKTVTKEVSTPQYEEVKLYDEDGEEIGTHQIPVMEEYEVESAMEAVEAVTEQRLVSEATEAVEAVYEKQYSVWDELFPGDNSYRQKALYNMPEGDLKDWINEWCEAKRVEMRLEVKWQKKRFGLVADAELTAEYLPEVVSINDEGEPTGIDTMTYIGILHSAIQELSAKVTALENA